MSKITYLLGAGASSGSLPAVENFEFAIGEVIRRLRQFISGVTDENASKDTDFVGVVFMAVEEMQMLLEGCNKHRSVDTFAKMLFLTQNDKERANTYRRVKCAIILFFELYRYFFNQTDKRYDAFFATILSNVNPKFPPDINILSWNYDYEFERAYMNYLPGKKDIHDVYDDLNIIHKNHGASKSFGRNFGILKINGTAGFFSKNNEITLGLNKHSSIASGDLVKDTASLLTILDQFDIFSKRGGFEPAISFSWEEDTGNTIILNEIEKALRDTQLLIVIGYSFPYFNRLIDQKILNSMQMGGAKVIIQNPMADEYIDTLNEMRYWTPNSVKPIKNCSQFYLKF